MPSPTCAHLAVLLTGTLLMQFVPATGLANPALDNAWSRRAEPGGLERAIAAHEAALREGFADVMVFERLLRLRFFRAQERLPEGSVEQKAEYRQCIADGLRGLERHGHSGRVLELDGPEDLDGVRDSLDRKAVGILYWMALCYGSTIRDASLLKQPGGAKRFRRLVECSLRLDERYFFGGPHRVLAEYLHAAPGIMGGDDDEARRHAEHAMRLYPRYPENPLCRAENVWKPLGNRDAFDADVAAALDATEEAAPDASLEYRAALDRARRLKERATRQR